MVDLTLDMFKSFANRAKWPEEDAPALDAAAKRFGIDTSARLAMWLAQLAHESAGFRYRREIWGPTEAQKRYEGRKDLGNVEKGDGQRYLGRGFIQLTGRTNYRSAGNALGLDLENNPDLAATPEVAALTAGWYWHTRGLSIVADDGTEEAFARITRAINGGMNGWPDRLYWWRRAKRILAV